MKRNFRLSLALAVVVGAWTVHADVWRDCTAWYMGGAETVGAFKDGDMTDIRHAAVADSPTHGGTHRANLDGISNLCETVYSAASGRTFGNQRTIYLAQRDGITSKGDAGHYENGVALPFAATNENYTLLFRVRLDDTQPTNAKGWTYVADMGYQGGSSKYAFSLRYNPSTEEIGVLYNNGSGYKSMSSTNDVCTTLRGKWLEMSVSLEKLASGKSRMRFGVAAEGLARQYQYADHSFPEGQSVPVKGKIYLAGVTGYGGVSSSCYPARGSYQMVSYWERVLTDDEILEAFKLQGPDGSAAQSTALLKFGDPAWSGEVFGGTIEGTSATPSLDLQDIGKVPMQIAAGQSLNLPFAVPETCTNLGQVVRIGATGTSAAASLTVSIDGKSAQPMAVGAGNPGQARFAADLFTAGSHVLTVSRANGETGDFALSTLEISGSMRLGWINGNNDEMGGDKGKATFTPTDLTTNGWMAVRSTVKSTAHSSLVFDLDATDVATRKITVRGKPCGYPAQKFDFVLQANGTEVYRRTYSPDKPYDDERAKLIAVGFRPGSLVAGTNAFTFKTEINAALDPEPSGTWLRFDSFELEVGDKPRGSLILFR